MSNYQALGGVSETMRALLVDRMEFPPAMPPGFRVSIGPPRPDARVDTEAAEAPRVNLFLYRVDENAALKNQQIPGRGNPSSYGLPPLSLDLHYLVTGYGTTQVQANRFDETLGQFLLGSAMRVFHDFPIIADNLTSVRQPLGVTLLHPSLRGEFERVKITLEPVSLEDISKIWTALTLPFKVSAAYVVNVVQIESTRQQTFPRRVQPPPGGPRIFVVPMQTPQIQEIRVRWLGDALASERTVPVASIGDTLFILGENLASPATRVRIGELEIQLGRTHDSRRLEVVIPDANLPDGSAIPDALRLQPGVQTVDVTAGIPELPAAGFPSNQSVFLLTPRITPPVTANLAGSSRTVTISGVRLFHPTLSGEALLDRAVLLKDAYLSASETTIQLPVPDTLAGWPISALVSAPLVLPLADLTANPMLVTIGTDVQRAVTIGRNPATLDELPLILERAFHSVVGGGPRYADLRAGISSDGRLYLVPGGARESIAVAAGTGDILLLTAGTGGSNERVFQSTRLPATPAISSLTPQFQVQVDAIAPAAITLPSRPTSLAGAATLMQAAIRAANPTFALMNVLIAGSQLLFHFLAAAAVRFLPAAADALSILELGLASEVAVRVRVNGAETPREEIVSLTA